MHIFKTADFQ